jgi:hypothetical protein
MLLVVTYLSFTRFSAARFRSPALFHYTQHLSSFHSSPDSVLRTLVNSSLSPTHFIQPLFHTLSSLIYPRTHFAHSLPPTHFIQPLFHTLSSLIYSTHSLCSLSSTHLLQSASPPSTLFTYLSTHSLCSLSSTHSPHSLSSPATLTLFHPLVSLALFTRHGSLFMEDDSPADDADDASTSPVARTVSPPPAAIKARPRAPASMAHLLQNPGTVCSQWHWPRDYRRTVMTVWRRVARCDGFGSGVCVCARVRARVCVCAWGGGGGGGSFARLLQSSMPIRQRQVFSLPLLTAAYSVASLLQLAGDQGCRRYSYKARDPIGPRAYAGAGASSERCQQQQPA